MRVYAIVCLFLLVGCGTTPSPQQAARDTVQHRQENREQLRTIRYGDTIESVHKALSEQFTPYLDVQTETGFYSIETFEVAPYYRGNGSEVYLALYKNNRLTAITRWYAVKPDTPQMILLHVQQLVTNKNKDKCDLYTSPAYYEKLIANIQQHTLKVADQSFIPSEEEIYQEIAGLSDKEGHNLTANDAVELAILSPVLIFALPVSVAASVATAPVMIPMQNVIESKQSKESTRRATVTKELLPTLRAIPLGLTMAETDRLEAEKIPGIKASQPAKTRCSTVMVGKTLDMTYDEVYLYHDDKTFVRLYPKLKRFQLW